MNEQLMKYREIVMKNKRPRRLTVQPDVILADGKAKYQKYGADTFGCIDSGIAHFSENSEDILSEWKNNNQ